MMSLKKIEQLAKMGLYEEALIACDDLFKEQNFNKVDVLRTRAFVFARSGDYGSAVRDREAIIETGKGEIRDYYRAADNALSAGQLTKATIWFEIVLKLGKEINETWFKAASYFLLAFTQMELGSYDAALSNLQNAVIADPDVSMPLPHLCGMCGHEQLRNEILKRKGAAI